MSSWLFAYPTSHSPPLPLDSKGRQAHWENVEMSSMLHKKLMGGGAGFVHYRFRREV